MLQLYLSRVSYTKHEPRRGVIHMPSLGTDLPPFERSLPCQTRINRAGKAQDAKLNQIFRRRNGRPTATRCTLILSLPCLVPKFFFKEKMQKSSPPSPVGSVAWGWWLRKARTYHITYPGFCFEVDSNSRGRAFHSRRHRRGRRCRDPSAYTN